MVIQPMVVEISDLGTMNLYKTVLISEGDVDVFHRRSENFDELVSVEDDIIHQDSSSWDLEYQDTSNS